MNLRNLMGTLLAASAIAISAGCTGQNQASIEEGAVSGELLVGVRAGTVGSAEVEAVIARAGTVLHADVSGSFYRILLSAGLSRAEAEARLVHPDILYVEPNYLAWGYAAPGDASGNTGWSTAFDTEIKAAWGAYGALAPAGNVLVAVLDTGVLDTHEDLTGKLDKTPAKLVNYSVVPATTGLAAVQDDNGHGSQVTGVVAAEGGNAKGGLGTSSWDGAADPKLVKVLPVKVADASNVSNHAAIANGIFWILNGAGSPVVYTPRAQVILLSMGSPSPSWTLQYAVQEAYRAGVLVVAAAGNDGTSLARYPAAYQASNQAVLSVSSADAADAIDAAAPGAANFGTWVNMLAPGSNLTAPGNASTSTYTASLRGSSFAAAHVAGAAGLIWTLYPPTPGTTHVNAKLTLDELRMALLSSVDSYDRAAGKNIATGGGRLDLQKALTTAGRMAADGTKVYAASVTFSNTSVKGGTALTGTVALSGPALAAGSISLVSGDPSVVVPASVSIAQGARTVNFAITTRAVAADVAAASVTATYPLGVSAAGYLKVKAPNVSKVSFAAPTLTEGGSVTGTVTLDGPAPTGGSTVALDNGADTKTSFSASAAAGTGTASIAAGSVSGTFKLYRTASAVTAQAGVVVTVTATASGKFATVKVVPLLSAVTLNPVTVKGGTSVTGTVKLAGPAPAAPAVVSVVLTKGGAGGAAATVPASVTVPPGSTSKTFTITTVPVGADTSITVSGAYAGADTTAATATLAILGPAVSAVSVTPSTVIYFKPDGAASGSIKGAGRVTLDGNVSADTDVCLTTNDPIVAVDPKVTVTAAGTRNYATFTVTPAAAVAAANVVISAKICGSAQAAKTASVVVKPALQAMTLLASTVAGGVSTTGTITLNGAAPTGGFDVLVSSSDPTATIAGGASATVTVPAGASTATFTVATAAHSGTVTAAISADALGVTKTVNLKITAPVMASITLASSSVAQGATVVGTATLNGPAPTGGVVVGLVAAPASAVTIPASVTVSAGATSATFNIVGGTVPASTAVSITGSTNASSKSVTITVNATAVDLVSVAVSPVSVFGGTSVTGTVTLNQAATAATDIGLASNNAAAVVPLVGGVAKVTVAKGATTASFTVTTTAVGAQAVATITATLAGGSTRTATLTVDTSTTAVASLTFPAGNITPGPGVIKVGTVTLTGNAPLTGGGATVNLVSSDPAVVVPASVLVPSGASQATFNATATTPVDVATPVSVAASYGGATKLASLLVIPPVALSVSVAAVTLEAGATSPAITVTLNGPASPSGTTIAVASGATGTATVSGNVAVAAGATTGTFTVHGVAAGSTTATLTPNAGAPVTVTVNVVAAGDAAVASLGPSTATVAVGGATAVTMTLDSYVAANTAITVGAVADPSIASVSAPANVLAGAASAQLSVTGLALGTSTVDVNVGTTAAMTLNITVKTPEVASVSPTTASVAVAATQAVTVTLDIPTGTSPVVVSLSSDTPAKATVPATVTVLAGGNRTASFNVTGVASGTATVTASANGGSATVAVTVP